MGICSDMCWGARCTDLSTARTLLFMEVCSEYLLQSWPVTGYTSHGAAAAAACFWEPGVCRDDRTTSPEEHDGLGIHHTPP